MRFAEFALHTRKTVSDRYGVSVRNATRRRSETPGLRG